MAGTSYRKCPNCSTMNLNSDYCTACGALINAKMQRELERKTRREAKEQEAVPQKPNAITEFFENAMQHPKLPVRLVAKFFYSIWAVIISIGTLLAFIFSYAAA